MRAGRSLSLRKAFFPQPCIGLTDRRYAPPPAIAGGGWAFSASLHASRRTGRARCGAQRTRVPRHAPARARGCEARATVEDHADIARAVFGGSVCTACPMGESDKSSCAQSYPIGNPAPPTNVVGPEGYRRTARQERKAVCVCPRSLWQRDICQAGIRQPRYRVFPADRPPGLCAASIAQGSHNMACESGRDMEQRRGPAAGRPRLARARARLGWRRFIAEA